MNDNKTERNENIELLRVVSMIMILMLHYLAQGKVLELTTKDINTFSYYIIWIVDGFCLISVNSYMLISGYFLSGKVFSWRRLLSFYSTVLFYSIILSLFSFLSGIADLSIRNMLAVFPVVGSRSNWYVTVYFAILLLSPLLNSLANHMDRVLYRHMLIVLFFLFSVLPTIVFTNDQFNLINGYSILWYGYLYLVAAYIRRFGYDISKKKSIGMILSIVLVPISKFIISMMTEKYASRIPFSEEEINSASLILYAYNSVPVFTSSLAFFAGILKAKRRIKNRKVISSILFFGKRTFGIFYIHTFVLLRGFLWTFMGSKNYVGSPFQIIHGLIIIIFVFLGCAIIDTLKSFLFRLLRLNDHINGFSDHIDAIFPL